MTKDAATNMAEQYNKEAAAGVRYSVEQTSHEPSDKDFGGYYVRRNSREGNVSAPRKAKSSEESAAVNPLELFS